MEPLRIGVIGVGHLGALHVRMLKEIPTARLVGICDTSAERLAKVAAEYDVRAYPGLGELLRDVDALTIATPTSTHCEVAAKALQSGKHCFVEKPVTRTVEEAESLCRMAAEGGLILQVGHIERFNPAILALEPYEIHPLFIESHRLSQFNPRGTDVPVVLDLMIHDIDLILSFVRSPVKSVEASGVAVVSDTVDIANARIQFMNGCVANVTASRISQRKMRKMRLFQPNRYISIDFSDGTAEVFRLAAEGESEVKRGLVVGELGSGTRKRSVVYEQPEVKEGNALKHELGLYVHSVQNGVPPIVSGEDGKRALEIANTIMDKINQQVMPS